MEEEPGDGRYQVYVTLPPGTTLDDFDLAWPTGTSIVDDSGDNATVELGPASPHDAAHASTSVAATLAAGRRRPGLVGDPAGLVAKASVSRAVTLGRNPSWTARPLLPSSPTSRRGSGASPRSTASRSPCPGARSGWSARTARGRPRCSGCSSAYRTDEGPVEVAGRTCRPIHRGPQPARLHARARLPAARSDRGRPGVDLGEMSGLPARAGAPACVRRARPRRPRRGPVPPDRGLLDGHEAAHEARAGARRGS